MSHRPGSTLIASVDHLRARRNRQRAYLPYRCDALAFYQDDAVPERTPSVAVDQRAAHERLDSLRLSSIAPPAASAPAATTAAVMIRIRIEILHALAQAPTGPGYGDDTDT